MYNAGQSCCGIERAYIHKDLYEEFIEKAKDLISKYKLGVLIAKKMKLQFKKIIPKRFDLRKFIIRPKNMSLSNLKLLTKYPNLKKYLLLNSQINLLKKDY